MSNVIKRRVHKVLYIVWMLRYLVKSEEDSRSHQNNKKEEQENKRTGRDTEGLSNVKDPIPTLHLVKCEAAGVVTEARTNKKTRRDYTSQMNWHTSTRVPTISCSELM